MSKPSIVDVMRERPIIGDGSYVIALEKRGYVKAGPFTVETVIENPDAVKQLHKDYLWAGADVIQALTFYATDGKLVDSESSKHIECEELNQAACDLAREVADTGSAYVCGGVSPTPTYSNGKGDKSAVQAEYNKQIQVFIKNNVDLILGEFFGHVEEAEWAIEAMKKGGIPVACTLRMGPRGDLHGVPPGECAVRMARAGANIIGLNCQYDPATCLKTLALMKEGLKTVKLDPLLMIQPLGFHCPEVAHCPEGYHELPEYPFALEPRLLTRWDARWLAREAYNLGVRYLGGCCGFEPYHIREMAEELAEERGKTPPGHSKWGDFGSNLKESMFDFNRKKVGKEYWMSLKPASGRPDSKTASIPVSKQ